MWLSGILRHGASRLISQLGNTMKSPWGCSVTSRYLSWYYLRCCKDIKLQQSIIMHLHCLNILNYCSVLRSHGIIAKLTIRAWCMSILVTHPPTPSCGAGFGSVLIYTGGGEIAQLGRAQGMWPWGIPVTAITYSCAAIHVPTLYNLQHHQSLFLSYHAYMVWGIKNLLSW